MIRIHDVNAFARAWFRQHRLPLELLDDAVQEAHLAALVEGPDRRVMVRAMDRFRKREYRTMSPLSALDGLPPEDSRRYRF